jgi:hypothetical protein
MSTITKVSYYNTFWNKKVVTQGPASAPGLVSYWPGLPWNPAGYPVYPNDMTIVASDYERNWMIEESRIVGGYNNTSTDLGVRAYINEEKINQRHRFNSLIYSGVYNANTGVNSTNVFSVSENISKSIDPSYGEIKRTVSYDTNLIILQESKVSQSLIDKDTIYTSEDGTATNPPGTVLGQTIPYVGEFGIGNNPESFADFGMRKYFADPYRGSILRLSRDGLTEISQNGMTDYFRDELEKLSNEVKPYVVENTTNTTGTVNSIVPVSDPKDIEIGMNVEINNLQTNSFVTDVSYVSPFSITLSSNITLTGVSDLRFVTRVKDKIVGGWDIYDRQYSLSMQKKPQSPNEEMAYQTLSFDESVKGWTSLYTYNPSNSFSLKNSYYTTFNGGLWKHYDESVINNRGTFYNTHNSSFVDFIFNTSPSAKKVFQTVNYEGDNGYQINYFKSDSQQTDPDIPLTSPSTYLTSNSYQDTSVQVYSYDQGLYTDTITGQPKRAGFDRKENLYVANLINNSSARPDEVVFGVSMSGIKGYFARVKISTDNYTNVGGLKEIWSVGSKFVQSS